MAAKLLIPRSRRRGMQIIRNIKLILLSFHDRFLNFKEMYYPANMEFIAPYLPYLAFLISVFSALRLAKFNNDTRQTSSFVGLPVPANALFWGSLVAGAHDFLISDNCHPVYLLILVCLFSGLLVSEIPMFSLNKENTISEGATPKLTSSANESRSFPIMECALSARANNPSKKSKIELKAMKSRASSYFASKASTENERSTVVIETPEGVEILTRQIAGAVARRIVTYAEVGEECYIDEHMGFIKFGSRVDVYLPIGTEICVKMGQLTTGNQTVIAKLK